MEHLMSKQQRVATVARQLWCDAMLREGWYDEEASVALLVKCWRASREAWAEVDRSADALQIGFKRLQEWQGEPPLPF